MPPKFNRRRALFVLGKIDEILAWEQRKETERDTKFVELGRYLCEVRAGQYWRLEGLKCFDEFLERRFPGSRRKADSTRARFPSSNRRSRRAVRMLGSDKSRGYCLEMMCADFPAGANLDSGTTELALVLHLAVFHVPAQRTVAGVCRADH
jgi:hypothetical protein